MPAAYREILLLLAVASLLAFATNALSPGGIALVGQWDATEGVVSAFGKNAPIDPGIEIDDIDIAKQRFDSGDTVFVDARPSEVFQEGHISGSVSLPVRRFDDTIMAFMDAHPVETPLVTYCSGRSCEDSHQLAQLLRELGYENVRVMVDGYPDWKAKGYPVE
ncbi:MAG: rhodanese-like domain-containing protein [Desulfobacterales bacterium]|jgi:rhodanese-related sulfurtransferase